MVYEKIDEEEERAYLSGTANQKSRNSEVHGSANKNAQSSLNPLQTENTASQAARTEIHPEYPDTADILGAQARQKMKSDLQRKASQSDNFGRGMNSKDDGHQQISVRSSNNFEFGISQ